MTGRAAFRVRAPEVAPPRKSDVAGLAGLGEAADV